jgi:hypothetical protein
MPPRTRNAARNARQVIRPDGQLRQSQMVTTFGPGAMVDLVDRAIVVGGLEHWASSRAKGFESLDDARLRAALVPRLKALHPELDLAKQDYFRKPPEGDGSDPSPSIGVRALEFPKWLVCQGCKRLARAAESFENKNGRYRHECRPNSWSPATPVRFVSACKRGHLSDFAWSHFAHQGREGRECENPKLELEEGALGDIARIYVRCTNCGSVGNMRDASNLRWRCHGERPWLGGRAAQEECDQTSELLVRTASHAYFAQVVSALRLPPEAPDPVRLRVHERAIWGVVGEVTTLEELSTLLRVVPAAREGLKGIAPADVLAAILAERSPQATTERPLRSAEYDRLTIDAPEEAEGSIVGEGQLFAAFRVPPARAALPHGIGGLTVVPELREVRVQVSFSRFDSVHANLQGEYDFEGRAVKPAVLTLPSGNEKWLPAAEVRGEGIFLELDRAALLAWEQRPEVQARAELLHKAFSAEGRDNFPSLRFYLLHSLSHLLLTAISLECGYAASAIRERIYCGKAEPGGADMAGIMLSTGTTGSEGTLGGLVEEGRRIRHHLREAWDLGRLCSNDPVCAAHDPSHPSSDRRTEGAACHGCLYIAECSCEWFNRFLDRALVVPTVGNPESLAFFQARP